METFVAPLMAADSWRFDWSCKNRGETTSVPSHQASVDFLDLHMLMSSGQRLTSAFQLFLTAVFALNSPQRKVQHRMSLSCLRSSDPNITDVDQLYDDRSKDGSLYSGSGTPPLCSSTSPPPPSGCEVCFDQVVHAVCCELQKNVKLVMEGAGQEIDLIKSECPRLLGDDAWKWWLPVLLAVVMIVLLVVFCKLRKCERSPKTLKEVTDAVDSSEVEPVAEAEAEV